jgi:hypothetical protein
MPEQIQRVITIIKLCNNMDDFREKFARVFKKSPVQLSLFDFDLGPIPDRNRGSRSKVADGLATTE